MTRMMTVWGFVGLMGASMTAQAGTMDKMQMDKMGKSVTVTGCVATGAETGSYMLTDGMTMNDKTGKSYDLMGGNLKTHLGHKVAITGTVEAMKMAGKDKPMTAGKMGQMDMAKMHMGLRVKSVKMIAATCS